MSRRASIIPTNLLEWPNVIDLDSSTKLVLLWLWSCGYIGTGGSGVIPTKIAATILGLSNDTVVNALYKLKDVGAIMYSPETEEVLATGWYRHHKFAGKITFSVLESEIKKRVDHAIKLEMIKQYNIVNVNLKGVAIPENLDVDINNVVERNFCSDSAISFSASPSKPVKETSRTKSVKVSPDLEECWLAYVTVYNAKYRVDPLMGSFEKSVIRLAINTMGLDATKEVLQYYLNSTDAFFLKNTHSLAIFKQSMSKLHTELQRKKLGLKPNLSPITLQNVKDTLSGMHHNFADKDYRAGIDENGHLID